MEAEKRRHPRFNPKGITASICIIPPSPDEEVSLQGTIVDMSYSGVKIKLSSAMPEDLPKSKIRIDLTLPESGIPFTINGVIKHISEPSECGFHYSEHHSEDEVDELMFECVKCDEKQLSLL